MPCIIWGEPIPPEELPHIFERFRRGDKARGSAGYGLGLAIARNMAEALGGTLTVESSREAGTTFTLLLRCHTECKNERSARRAHAQRPASQG